MIFLKNIHELHATAQSTPPNEDDEQLRPPTILLEVSLGNNVHDLTKDKEDDDDVILALRELDQEMCLDDGMEMSTIPDWLMRSMEKSKKMVKV